MTRDGSHDQPVGVSVILTVKNDADGCVQTLESLTRQTRLPDEVVIVDGGSTDQTVPAIRTYEAKLTNLRVVDAPGANIANGREIATRQARSPIIASIDAGCRAAPDWLEKLVEPFELDETVEVSAGMYKIAPQTLFEEVVGLATMRGQLEPVDPRTFNPSARSMAYSKDVWKRAGGWPVWLGFSEDTLFDHRLRRVATGWHFAGDAVVHWRPRTSFLKLARQFYSYGTGRGHTQIGASDFAYNLRNIALLMLTACGVWLSPWATAVAGGLFLYFFVWAYHRKAVQIVRRTRRLQAYPMTLMVLWVVMISNLAGYLHGSWQRVLQAGRFRRQLEWYMTA